MKYAKVLRNDAGAFLTGCGHEHQSESAALACREFDGLPHDAEFMKYAQVEEFDVKPEPYLRGY